MEYLELDAANTPPGDDRTAANGGTWFVVRPHDVHLDYRDRSLRVSYYRVGGDPGVLGWGVD